MLVPFRPRPHRGQGDHVGEVEGGDRRLADIGISVTGQAPEPGLDRVHALDRAGEVAPLDDLLDQPEVLRGERRVTVPHGDGRGHIGDAGMIGAKLLQGHVGIGGLVRGVAVDERRLLVGHHLLEDRGDRLALGKPLPPDFRQQLGRVGLVEHDRAGRPAIGEGEPVEIVEKAGPGRGRKARDRQGPQMLLAEPRLEPADERLVGEKRVEIDRRLGHPDALTLRRYRRMQIGQRLAVIEPFGLGHEAFDEMKDAVRPVDEAREMLPRVDPRALHALIKPAFRPRGILGRRHPQEGQIITALEMRSFLPELLAALHVDQCGCRIGERGSGIVARRQPLRLHEQGPARAEAPDRIVEPGGDRDELGGGGAVEIGTAEGRGSLEGAILVQHRALGDQRDPGEIIGKAGRLRAIFGEVHHGRIQTGYLR